jgi:hypothetical protein
MGGRSPRASLAAPNIVMTGQEFANDWHTAFDN